MTLLEELRQVREAAYYLRDRADQRVKEAERLVREEEQRLVDQRRVEARRNDPRNKRLFGFLGLCKERTKRIP